MTLQPIIATPFSMPDMLMIFLVVLLLFGAKKLPELAKGMGQAIVREFTKAKDEIEKEITKPAESKPYEPPVIVEQPKELQEHKPAETAATAATPSTTEPPQHS